MLNDYVCEQLSSVIFLLDVSENLFEYFLSR